MASTDKRAVQAMLGSKFSKKEVDEVGAVSLGGDELKELFTSYIAGEEIRTRERNMYQLDRWERNSTSYCDGKIYVQARLLGMRYLPVTWLGKKYVPVISPGKKYVPVIICTSYIAGKEVCTSYIAGKEICTCYFAGKELCTSCIAGKGICTSYIAGKGWVGLDSLDIHTRLSISFSTCSTYSK